MNNIEKIIELRQENNDLRELLKTYMTTDNELQQVKTENKKLQEQLDKLMNGYNSMEAK